MSYKDPYAERYGQYDDHDTRNDGPSYNPYGPSSHGHEPYDQGVNQPYAGGYRDEPIPSQATLVTDREAAPAPKERVGFEPETLANLTPRRGRTAKDLRTWRYEHQGDLWSKGGRGSCICRFCGCTIFVGLFLLLSVVFALLLWIRPPNVQFNDVGAPSNGSSIQLTANGVNINLGVNFTVQNPNFFAVKFSKIQADITYPINNTAIGSGTATNLVFNSHATTNFEFPFTIAYTVGSDPGNRILTDLATKCGVIGGTQSDITVNYKITLGIKILFVPITPVISNSFKFACPLSASDIAGLLKDAGITLDQLGGL